jgi:hypothetical protein
VNNRSIPSMHAERKITVCSHKHSFTAEKILPIFLINTLLFHIPLLALTDRQNDGQRNKCTRCACAGGTFFQLCCCVSFWFWREIGFGFIYYVLRVQYSCGVVLVFWFWQEIVFGVNMYLVYNTVVLLCLFFGCGGK